MPFTVLAHGDSQRPAELVRKAANETSWRMSAEIFYLGDAESPEDIMEVGDALPQWAEELDIKSGEPSLAIFDLCGAKPEIFNAIMPLVLSKEVAGKEYKNLNFCLIVDNKAALPRPLAARCPIINK